MKSLICSARLAVAIACLSIGSLFSPLSGATVTFTWDGSTDGNISDDTNWSGGSAPPTSKNQAKDDHWIFPSITGTTTVVIDQAAGGNPKLQNVGTITFASGSNAYTINSDGTNFLIVTGEADIDGGGADNLGIRNLGSNEITFNTDLYLQGLQTWDSGSTDNGGNLIFTGDVNFDNNADTLTFSGANDYTFNTITNGTGSTTSIDMTGTGTTLVNGTLTNINEIDVSAGTLMLGADDLVSDTNAKKSSLTLSGGTFDANGYDVAFRGTLTLTADSTIDFDGSGSGGVVDFGDSSGEAWTYTLADERLYITGWDGDFSTGGGTDQLIFGSGGLTDLQVSQIIFVNPGQHTGQFTATLLANGEVVPVPEASTMIGGGLAVLGLFYFELKRRRKPVA